MDPAEIKRLMDERDELFPMVNAARAHIEEQQAALLPLANRLHEVELILINESNRRWA